MAETALGGALPAGDANGLDALAAGLVAEPHRLRAVLVLLDCAKIVQKTDSGERIAVARVRRIEAILGEDFGAAERLIRRSLEKRTGQTVLPLDLEDDLRAAFAEIDLAADAEPDADASAGEAEAEADTPPEPGDQAGGAEPEPPAKGRRGRKPRASAEPEPPPAEAAPEPAEPEIDPDGPDPADLAEPWDDDPRNDPPEG